MILSDPVIPIKWGMEQRGMQTGAEATLEIVTKAEAIWRRAMLSAVNCADELAELGIHKSLCNRITEPWMWITTLMTATSWKNFFRLRVHPDAEVHFQKIAGMVKMEMDKSIPGKLALGDWHLPYISIDDMEDLQHYILQKAEAQEMDAALRLTMIELLKKISAGRCARLSYLTHEGIRSTQADVDLCDRLINRTDDVIHASPLEHVNQCRTKDHRSGPFKGWHQFRKEFPQECADND